MNAFFISCEMTRNDSLVGIPAAVAGDPKKRSGIILAANYEARSCGVKTAMVLHEALKLCPKLTLVPPDHHFYGQKSEEVMDLLSNYTPVLEQNSIDEAWLDMAGSEGLFGKPVVAAKRIMVHGLLNNKGHQEQRCQQQFLFLHIAFHDRVIDDPQGKQELKNKDADDGWPKAQPAGRHEHPHPIDRDQKRGAIAQIENAQDAANQGKPQ